MPHEPVILPYRGVRPKIAGDAFVAPGAVVIGDVEIGPGANVWFGCILRGDVNTIRVGARANVQDGTIVHVNGGDGPTFIGAGVVIGHKCLIHACTLEDGAFIGMGATVLDNAVVEGGAMVAAGAMVTPGKRVPRGQLWAGRPAKPFRDLGPEDDARTQATNEHYHALAMEYREALRGG